MIDLQPYAEFCEWAPTFWLVASENVFDPLIYYSHLVPLLLSLPLAVVVLLREPRQRLNQYFFLVVTLFSAWSIGDLILWAHADPGVIMSVWSLLILLEPLIYISALLFAHQVLFKKSISTPFTFALSLLILPTIFFLPTSLAIDSFNLTNCWREVNEGVLVFYGYFVQVLIALSILFLTAFYAIRSKDDKEIKQRSVLAAVGIILFLATFSLGNIIGSWYEDWTIGQYGLFGMPILVAFIGFLIARYKIFNTRILSAEILTAALAVLNLGILFIQSLATVRIVAIVTLFLVVIIGVILIRSVRREDEQLAQIEALAKRLEKANVRLRQLDKMKSEFVSIASHQLRSPLTSIRGYASMLMEGSFGKIPKKAEEPLERISESAKLMVMAVEDYLNVSRIESGNMKYNLSDFNLKDQVSNICDDLRPEAIKQGLVLLFRSDIKSRGVVNADVGKTAQIVHNLINNSIKYTTKGSIKVVVRDDSAKKKIYVDIIDTGIGMSQKTIDKVFEKFERAHNANSVNVTGTGLGLYVALKMAEAMGGDIVAKSDGEGKGSVFTFELPLAM